jgi:hypothetical protein
MAHGQGTTRAMPHSGANRLRKDGSESPGRNDTPRTSYLARDPAGCRDTLPDDVSDVAADGAA